MVKTGIRFFNVLPAVFCMLVSFTLASCSSQSDIAKTSKPSTRFEFHQIAATPIGLTESSGLINLNGNLWTHNDSGMGSKIFKIDSLGNVLQTVTYKNLRNVDWEAFAQDGDYVYVGDFGNNYGNRKDQTIYKIPKSKMTDPNADPEKIQFSFADQTDFSIRPQNHSFDMEAMVVINGKIYLFSKDWRNFTTTVYKLTNEPGNHQLQKLQTLDSKCVVTDATYNPISGEIILTGYNTQLTPYFIRVEKNEDNFTLIDRQQLSDQSSQIEAITYYKSAKGKHMYYLTSEAVSVSIDVDEATVSGAIYKLTISD